MHHRAPYLLLAMAGTLLGSTSQASDPGEQTAASGESYSLDTPNSLRMVAPPQSLAATGSTWNPYAGMQVARHRRVNGKGSHRR